MKTALALAVAGIVLVTATATTAFAASKSNKSNRVTISYVPPKNPAHQLIYDGLKERRPLEKLQEFLAPFRLPRMLKISLAGCAGEADAFYGDDTITICYEYIDELWKNMPAETVTGIAPIDTVLGPFFDTSLHEFAHALFDMFDLPLLGREEDAADRVATYIFLQLGKNEARRLITATATAFKVEAERAAAEPPLLKQFASEHGTPAQRAYNVLCIAYGADPKLFGDFVTNGNLPKERAESCDDEYGQVLDAFEILISPHIDRALAKRVLDKSWLPERTTRVQRRLGPPEPSHQK